MAPSGASLFHRRRPRPVLARAFKRRGRDDLAIEYARRELGRGFALAIGRRENKRFVDPGLMVALRKAVDTDAVEAILVGALRNAADRATASRLPVIGRHCKSVAIPPPRFRSVRIRYLEAESGTAMHPPIVGYNGVETRPAAAGTYSPSMLAQGGFQKPAIAIGRFRLGVGPFTVIFDAPAVPGMMGMRPQPRRPEPPSRVRGSATPAALPRCTMGSPEVNSAA